MPIPIILGGLAIAAAATGVGTGIHGGMKMKSANDTMKLAQETQEHALRRFNEKNEKTTDLMDQLGVQELKILNTFEGFSDLIEKIQGRPEFKEYAKEGIELPKYEEEELKKISAGAGALLGGVSGAAAGTAGGFAASGAAYAAVMALGTASTGTAISTLSGVAATNAALAALGGGAIAAGGGGIALGTAVLGGATLGVGLLIGGIIFNVTGSKLSEKADEALVQAERTKQETDKIVEYLGELTFAASRFKDMLTEVETLYRKYYNIVGHIVNFEEKHHWSDFTQKEKNATENAVLLVGLLYRMCQVKLVLKSEDEQGLNTVNNEEIDKTIADANYITYVIDDAA